MEFKIHNVIENEDGSAIVNIDVNTELKVFVRKHYKRKRCTSKLLSRFLNEGIDLYIERFGLCKKQLLFLIPHRAEHELKLPEGDILIHAGDFDINSPDDFNYAIKWMDKQPFKYKVLIGGNHDFYLEKLYKTKARYEGFPKHFYYLCNEWVKIEGIKIWGSPFSPIFNDWAFMEDLATLKEAWDLIPSDTDIVVTHCPAFGINDQVQPSFISVGCPALRDKLKSIKPKYHICGHIHEAYGVYQDEHTTYINASLLDEYYAMVNKPVEIEYEN